MEEAFRLITVGLFLWDIWLFHRLQTQERQFRWLCLAAVVFVLLLEKQTDPSKAEYLSTMALTALAAGVVGSIYSLVEKRWHYLAMSIALISFAGLVASFYLE